VHIRTILGLCRDYIRTILGLYQDYVGIYHVYIRAKWAYIGAILGLYWRYIRTIVGLCRDYIRTISGLYWDIFQADFTLN
jgi:hypothetical protein